MNNKTKCICTNEFAEYPKSWCGRPLHQEEFFETISQAVFNGIQKGGVVTCPDCARVLVDALTYREEIQYPNHLEELRKKFTQEEYKQQYLQQWEKL